MAAHHQCRHVHLHVVCRPCRSSAALVFAPHAAARQRCHPGHDLAVGHLFVLPRRRLAHLLERARILDVRADARDDLGYALLSQVLFPVCGRGCPFRHPRQLSVLQSGGHFHWDVRRSARPGGRFRLRLLRSDCHVRHGSASQGAICRHAAGSRILLPHARLQGSLSGAPRRHGGGLRLHVLHRDEVQAHLAGALQSMENRARPEEVPGLPAEERS